MCLIKTSTNNKFGQLQAILTDYGNFVISRNNVAWVKKKVFALRETV